MKKGKKFWQFKQSADDESVGELLLYGEIADSSWWGDEVTPKQFKADLDALGDISTLNIYINSPGGDCFAGQAIYSMLKRCKATKNVYIDGLAASMASVVACAGDKVIMPINAMMMIHNPWTIAIGNANDFRNMADTMDKIGESSIAVYTAKSGMKNKDVKQLMDDETWMSAQDALDMGFCDQIEEAVQVAASISGDTLNINGLKMSLSRFKSFPVAKIQFKQGVVPPNISTKKAADDTEWSKPVLKDFTDKNWSDLTDTEKKDIAGHYAWAAQMPPSTFGDLKFPHHDPQNGMVVWDGVANCAARLNQADIPDGDVKEVQDHIGAHYHQFDKTPPWETDGTKSQWLGKKKDDPADGPNDEDTNIDDPNNPDDEDINEDDDKKKTKASKPAESVKNQALPVSLYMKLAKINEKRAKI
ncbi:MAG: head maturation protease, ClpP-related [Veillonellales bacterium]